MYIKPKDFARKTNLPLEQIRKMCKYKRIPSIKIGPTYWINQEKAEKLFEEWEEKQPEKPINAISQRETQPKLKPKKSTKKVTEDCISKLKESM